VLAVPPYMELHLIRKYKLKNNDPVVKVCSYMGERCEWKVQLQWMGQRVGFIKSWSDFAARLGLRVDDTIAFTPKDDGFKVDVLRKETSCSSIFSCRRHREDLMLILAVKVQVLDPCLCCCMIVAVSSCAGLYRLLNTRFCAYECHVGL
jgi:hypothetical protein